MGSASNLWAANVNQLNQAVSYKPAPELEGNMDRRQKLIYWKNKEFRPAHECVL